MNLNLSKFPEFPEFSELPELPELPEFSELPELSELRRNLEYNKNTEIITKINMKLPITDQFLWDVYTIISKVGDILDLVANPRAAYSYSPGFSNPIFKKYFSKLAVVSK